MRVLGVGVALLQSAHAATWHVATNGNDGAAGTTWGTAKQTIQSAVDVAVSNDTILVSNGVYATGGRVVYGAMTNRVAITKQVTVRSVNGPALTVIRGAWCETGGILSNCTLTANLAASSGGGSYYGTLNNCTLSDNSASSGGGAYYGTLNNCIVYEPLAKPPRNAAPAGLRRGAFCKQNPSWRPPQAGDARGSARASWMSWPLEL